MDTGPTPVISDDLRTLVTKTIRSMARVVVLCVLPSSVLAIAIPYLSGFGVRIDWLLWVGGIYIALAQPVLCYRLLGSSSSLPLVHGLGRAFASILLAGSLSIAGFAAADFALGPPIGTQVQGIADRIEYRHVGPTLTAWAKREMARDSRAPSGSGKAMARRYESIDPKGVPASARWLLNDSASFCILRNDRGEPVRIEVGTAPACMVDIYADPHLVPASTPEGPLCPYPGITVGYYVR